MTRFILIRHGESEANRQGIFAGHIDPELMERGVRQAELTAKYIAENYTVDAIYGSDLKRAYNTGKKLGELLGLDVTPDKRFREIYAGQWENKKFKDLPELFPEDYGTWLNHIGFACCTGGESVKQLGERVMEGLNSIADENDGKTVVVATHATPIRVAQCIIQTGGTDEMENIPWVSNASFSIFEREFGEWRVVSVNNNSHLGEEKTELPKNV